VSSGLSTEINKPRFGCVCRGDFPEDESIDEEAEDDSDDVSIKKEEVLLAQISFLTGN
jgi:hypothetical protein